MTQEKELLESLKARNMLPPLQSGRVICWYSNLQWMGDRLISLSSLLSAEEQQKANFLASRRHSERYTYTHGLLNLLLGYYCDFNTAKIQIESTSFGKPLLKNGHVHFNLSHSDDACCIALSSSSEIGIDLEKIRNLDDLQELIDANFTKKERAYIRADKKTISTRFFQLWTAKESFLKYTGDGLQIDPKTIEFNCNQHGLSINQVTGLQDHFSSDTWPLSLEAGYAATITVESGTKIHPPIQLDRI